MFNLFEIEVGELESRLNRWGQRVKKEAQSPMIIDRN